MAIAFVRASTVSRSKGGAAAAALAYEACDKLAGMDGSMYDFRNKSSLETPTQIVGMKCNLQDLADKIELSEKRKNSTVARRYIVALPHEISKEERADLALGFLEHLNNEYGVAGAVTVHEPDKGGDERNYHAHITISDRAVNEHGEFGKKVRILTDMKTRNVELEKIKEHWERRCNEVLESQGKEKVREKSLVPGVHQGREATEMMRKGHSYKIEAEDWNKVCKDLSKEDKTLVKKKETYEELIRRLIGDDVEIDKDEKKRWEAEQRGEVYKETAPETKPVIRDFYQEYLDELKEEKREFEQRIKNNDTKRLSGEKSHQNAKRSESSLHQGRSEADERAALEGYQRDPRVKETSGESGRGKSLKGNDERGAGRILRKISKRHTDLRERNESHERRLETDCFPDPRKNLSSGVGSYLRKQVEESRKIMRKRLNEILVKGFKLPDKAKAFTHDLKDLFKGNKTKIQERLDKKESYERKRAERSRSDDFER